MADTKTTHLADLKLSEVQQIARDLGVRGWDMPDRAYLVKCIQAKRLANAKDAAQTAAQAAVDAVDPKAVALAETAEGADYDAMGVDELTALAAKRNLTVKGSGSGGNVLKGDLVAALRQS